MYEVWDGTLSVDTVRAAVEHPGAGGVTVFIGAVREVNEGRAVTKLAYEAYGTMAVREMQRIGDEITRDLPGTRVAAVHRVGELSVGEIAVVCAASATHRDEAFRACRALIDGIKARVPVWKREWGPDGPYWVGWQDARCGHPGHVGDHPGHGGASMHEGTRVPRVVTVTVSDTRTEETDTGGRTLREELSRAGCVLVRHCIVPDEPDRVQAEVTEALDTGEADVVVTTGGTGISPRDRTYEAVTALLDKTLEGFGEAFRRMSWEQVGPRAMLSRAVAGTRGHGVVIALPGSPDAVRLGARELIAPVLGHMVALAQRKA